MQQITRLVTTTPMPGAVEIDVLGLSGYAAKATAAAEESTAVEHEDLDTAQC